MVSSDSLKKPDTVPSKSERTCSSLDTSVEQVHVRRLTYVTVNTQTLLKGPPSNLGEYVCQTPPDFLPPQDTSIVDPLLLRSSHHPLPLSTLNRTEDSSPEVGCGVRCKVEQCTKGCEAWAQALDMSCQTVCNGTQELLPPKELYCVLGCHDALNRYFQQLKES
uniref:Uncharacterized protein n=1 Tax=Vespula pensylvanica TaxID=30213 RepID=A0A834PC22_VESPE|nr:hypothetical protein H0235_003488 [Vespula pensylvanica]